MSEVWIPRERTEMSSGAWSIKPCPRGPALPDLRRFAGVVSLTEEAKQRLHICDPVSLNISISLIVAYGKGCNLISFLQLPSYSSDR